MNVPHRNEKVVAPIEEPYVSRGRNKPHTIFERNSADCCERYNNQSAAAIGWDESKRGCGVSWHK